MLQIQLFFNKNYQHQKMHLPLEKVDNYVEYVDNFFHRHVDNYVDNVDNFLIVFFGLSKSPFKPV